MNSFDNEFEKAIRFITDAMPPAEQLEKPTLFHSIRVGVYLYLHNYSREICIAGLLHDAIEDTKITERDIADTFGKDITALVVANTKNNKLHGDEKWHALLQQCIIHGKDTLIVKAADILDNHIYYSRIQELEGLAYTRHITTLLFNLKHESYNDEIFTILKKTVRE